MRRSRALSDVHRRGVLHHGSVCIEAVQKDFGAEFFQIYRKSEDGEGQDPAGGGEDGQSGLRDGGLQHAAGIPAGLEAILQRSAVGKPDCQGGQGEGCRENL